MCVNHFNISHFDPGYAIIGSEYVFVILKREMSLFSSCPRCRQCVVVTARQTPLSATTTMASTSPTYLPAHYVLSGHSELRIQFDALHLWRSRLNVSSTRVETHDDRSIKVDPWRRLSLLRSTNYDQHTRAHDPSPPNKHLQLCTLYHPIFLLNF